MSSNQKDSCKKEDMQLSEEQIESLERNFRDCKHPDKTTFMLFAAEAGLSEAATMKWFKHRLSEWRKSEGLPSEIGSVMD